MNRRIAIGFEFPLHYYHSTAKHCVFSFLGVIRRREKEKKKKYLRMASRYWVVSLPVQNSASTLWNNLQQQISKHSFDTPLYRVHTSLFIISFFFFFSFHSISFSLFPYSQFNIPNLRVGTLDSLLSLSDDLLKVCNHPNHAITFTSFAYL